MTSSNFDEFDRAEQRRLDGCKSDAEWAIKRHQEEMLAEALWSAIQRKDLTTLTDLIKQAEKAK